MKELSLTIQNPTGLHARPAKVLSKLAKRYESNISIHHGEKEANAKSMISLLKLGVKNSAEIRLLITGVDESEASAALEEAILGGLGESIEGGHTDHAAAKTAAAPTSSSDSALPAHLLKGLPTSPGIAIGPVYRLKEQTLTLTDTFAGATAEADYLAAAKDAAAVEIRHLHQKMIDRGATQEADIFEAHLEILNDPGLTRSTEHHIHSGINAQHAWQSVFTQEADQLAALDDPTLAARAADMRDVGRRVLGLLTQHHSHSGHSAPPSEPYILVAVDLTPSDTASINPAEVLAIATSEGGPTAHSAIIARALGLPAVVAIGDPLEQLHDGQHVILNGDLGTVDPSPSESALTQAREKQHAQHAAAEAAQSAAGLPATTQDGHTVEVGGNAGSADEAAAAYAAGADGIGLLRTEFLFLGREEAPSETDQTDNYVAIVQAMQGRPTIFRTLDIGGDKPVPYIEVPKEENPFLGERGIRLQLNRPDLLKTQLRALLIAARSGPIRIMFPMIGQIEEYRAAKAAVEEVRRELGAPPIEVGIMIEIPSAALLAPVFAKEVDFFSIGTNDLTQYTLAVDRQHPTLTAHSDGLHPAVLTLIHRTIEAAHAEGKWVGICGELGSDPVACPILVGLGIDELSVNVKAIARVKAQVRTLSYEACRDLAQKALACGTAAEVRQLRPA